MTGNDIAHRRFRPSQRPLWLRRSDSEEGEAVLWFARRLSGLSEYAHLSDAELMRLAGWGTSGVPDFEGRAALAADIERRRAARRAAVGRLFAALLPAFVRHPAAGR
jgi:hypothetical protein